jgi:hypothetical protein
MGLILQQAHNQKVNTKIAFSTTAISPTLIFLNLYLLIANSSVAI